jgi:hypothetical protein
MSTFKNFFGWECNKLGQSWQGRRLSDGYLVKWPSPALLLAFIRQYGEHPDPCAACQSAGGIRIEGHR